MTYIDDVSHARPGLQPFPDRLFVVTAVSNPQRYLKRYEHYRTFAKRVADAGAFLYTVEAAFGDRPFEVTDAGNPRHVQVRTTSEIWLKENLLNIGINRLPAAARYIATVDAVLLFARPDWAQETLHQLQHAPVVQMFSEIMFLGPDNQTLGSGKSFMEGWMSGKPLTTLTGEVANRLYFHPNQVRAAAPESYSMVAAQNTAAPQKGSSHLGAPGGAWAYRREALDALGGLIDYVPIGSSDSFMALSLIGQLGATDLPYSAGLREMLVGWEARAERAIRGNVGMVPGTVLHHFHGKMSLRGYGTRGSIIIEHEFNPATDLKRDAQGVYQLHDDGSARFKKLRDNLRSYFQSRNEDSIEV